MLDGSWQRPLEAQPGGETRPRGADGRALPPAEQGLRAPAAPPTGVERGNILGWRQETAPALDGGRLEFGAEMDERSILSSTVMLFAGAVVLAVAPPRAWRCGLVRRGRRRPARPSADRAEAPASYNRLSAANVARSSRARSR